MRRRLPRRPAAPWPRAGIGLGSEARAAFVAPALEHRAPGAGAHAGSKAVRPGALSLLGLVGALHAAGPADGAGGSFSIGSPGGQPRGGGGDPPAPRPRRPPSLLPRIAGAPPRGRRNGPERARARCKLRVSAGAAGLARRPRPASPCWPPPEATSCPLPKSSRSPGAAFATSCGGRSRTSPSTSGSPLCPSLPGAPPLSSYARRTRSGPGSSSATCPSSPRPPGA